jgi:hypothetical protein
VTIEALAQRFDDFLNIFEEHRVDVRYRFDRVEQKQDETNGRVNGIEKWKIEKQAELRGAKRAVGWAPPILTGVASSVASALIVAAALGAL